MRNAGMVGLAAGMNQDLDPSFRWDDEIKTLDVGFRRNDEEDFSLR